MQMSFQAYYTARILENLTDKDKFIPVYASSNIEFYPFQIGAANFALYSPYKKGVVLCDESGMGKSHEAMIIIVQKWYEGQKILVATPNAELLQQWAEMIEKYYSVPYITITDIKQKLNSDEITDIFLQDSIVLTTYDIAVQYKKYIKEIKWDLMVFEEATALSSVYREDNKQAKILKEIANDSFKLLLTGTPIEKNIMDLYGLIYFIDDEILPDEHTFLKRYLRRPENYMELSKSISCYCYRTLRYQAKQYAKITNREFITLEYCLSKKEQKLYDELYNYCNKEKKLAFPDMSSYDLTLKLLDIQGSSTKAIQNTLDGIIKRLETIQNCENEIKELKEIKKLTFEIKVDNKTKELIEAIKSGFQILKKVGANKKAIIFTSSIITQKYLFDCLKDKYKTVIYNGSSNYSVIKEFKEKAEILISTDHGARGFNLEEASFVINYDLPYNTLKIEQRIDRCHRLNQKNDIISLAFIDKNNFADVRKLELINKRILVTEGVVGITDKVIGGFTNDIKKGMESINIRTKEEIEKGYQNILKENKEENQKIISNAENILFTTFTKQIADKVTIIPQYIEERTNEINNQIWELVKFYFDDWNKNHNDCCFEINEEEKTITAVNYDELPDLFYYWTGSRNKLYKCQPKYGMSKDFKPRSGRITLSSILVKGIINDIKCADVIDLILDKEIEPCVIALYYLLIQKNNIERKYNILVGKTQSGNILSEEECKKILQIPVIKYSESENKDSHWLKMTDTKRLDEYSQINSLVDINKFIEKQNKYFSEVEIEEIDRIKTITQKEKAKTNLEIERLKIKINEIEKEITENSRKRIEILEIKRDLIDMRDEYMKKEENKFFNDMQLDIDAENKINTICKGNIKTKLNREFLLNIKGCQ